MTWVKIDDGFFLHPKVVAAGPLAISMQICALCYCNKNLTDGFIPWSAARTLLSWEFLGPKTENKKGRTRYQISISSGMMGDDVDTEFVIGLLLDNGIWEEVDGGYMIHDYLDYQPSKEEILAERTQKVEAGRRGGKASAQARAQAPAKARAQAESNPVPVPVPVPVPSSNSSEELDSAMQKFNQEAESPIALDNPRNLRETRRLNKLLNDYGLANLCDAIDYCAVNKDERGVTLAYVEARLRGQSMDGNISSSGHDPPPDDAEDRRIAAAYKPPGIIG